MALAQRVNRKIILSNWLPGSGTPVNFTQSIQQQIQNARAVHFLSFVMPNFVTPFTPADGFFSFYQDGSTTLKQVAIDSSLFFTSITGFIQYMTTVFQASADPRIRNLMFTQDSTVGYSHFVLTLTDSGGTTAPAGYDGNPQGALYGNYLIGFAKQSYPFQATTVADGFPNVILRTNQIRLQTNLTASTYSANRDYNTTFAVPVNVNPGNLISFYSPYRIEFPAVLENIASITVKMVDDNGILLNIPSNCYASIVLAVECDE